MRIEEMMMYWNNTTAAFLAGFLLDLILGDPHSRFHPVCLIGNLIAAGEKVLRRLFSKTPKGELAAGTCLVVLVCTVSTGVPFVLLWGAYQIHICLGFVVETVLCYFLFATKSLKTESKRVADDLESQGLEAGRAAVSMIVGRDTERLSQEGVVKAAVETVAENTSDGVIAPMVYMALGGPVLGFFYKAINTMDSMVGYKNETYWYFGRAAARLDDVVNFIPARISALLMVGAAWLLPGFSGSSAARIFARDRYNHKSPNSAQTEAVMAGALGVQLAGDAWYFGVKQEKPTIGDDTRPVEVADIGRSHKLLYATAFLGMVLCVAIRLIVVGS